MTDSRYFEVEWFDGTCDVWRPYAANGRKVSVYWSEKKARETIASDDFLPHCKTRIARITIERRYLPPDGQYEAF